MLLICSCGYTLDTDPMPQPAAHLSRDMTACHSDTDTTTVTGWLVCYAFSTSVN